MILINAAKAVFEEATNVRNQTSKEVESKKLGIARAGSSGAITAGGESLYTQCGRLAQARLRGFERAPNSSLLTMFEGGLALENYIEKGLLASKAAFKKEEPVRGQIGGVVVTGRPDFDWFLNGAWVGMEVKSMASPFSAIKQVKNRFPLVKHLIQACTYMLLLERHEWLVAVGNIFFANERGFKVDPGVRWYRICQTADGFSVQNEHEEEMTLPFVAADIVRYYTELTKKTKKSILLSRPTEKELNMTSYDRCKYCHMASACNEYDAGQLTFEQWLQRAK